MSKRKTKTTETEPKTIEGTALVVAQDSLEAKPMTLDDYVNSVNTAYEWLKTSFKDNVIEVADRLTTMKRFVEQNPDCGETWESLFEKGGLRFGRRAADMYLTVASAKLGKYEDMLPADLSVRYKLATVPSRQREKVMIEYLKIVNVTDEDTGEEVKVNKQKAMTQARQKVQGSKAKKKAKGFNAASLARKLHADLGTDGLSELADAIERILEDEGVRE